MSEYNTKLKEYLRLLKQSYEDIVSELLEKYGPVVDDYYREKSYNKFLNEEIKSIAKGKYQRTKEGLYCHHIDENKFENISNLRCIRAFKYSYEHHRRERLVYCDLIEHLIIHAKISRETSGEYGYGGYTYLYDFITDWFVREKIPKPEWMQKCREKAYLPSKEAKYLQEELQRFIEPVEKWVKEHDRESWKQWHEIALERVGQLRNKIKGANQEIPKYLQSLSREELIENLYFIYHWNSFEDEETFSRFYYNISDEEVKEELEFILITNLYTNLFAN